MSNVRTVDPLEKVRHAPTEVKSFVLNGGAAYLEGETWEPIPSFPEEILACTNLTSLTIYNARIVDGTIPDRLGDLGQLTHLTLGTLSTETLPESLGKLTNLVHLSLDHLGKLQSLPEALGALSNLERLSLAHSGVQRLPPSLGELRSLVELNLGNTPLTEVPQALWNIPTLERLTLPRSVRALPPGIGASSRLVALHLSSAALESIAGELKGLTSLKSLRIAADPAGGSASIPDQIGELSALRELDASHLGLTTLPPALGRMPRLSTLRIRGNALTSVLGVLAAPALEVLEWDGNPLALSERRRIKALMALSPAERAAQLEAPATKGSKKAAAKTTMQWFDGCTGVRERYPLLVASAATWRSWRPDLTAFFESVEGVEEVVTAEGHAVLAIPFEGGVYDVGVAGDTVVIVQHEEGADEAEGSVVGDLKRSLADGTAQLEPAGELTVGSDDGLVLGDPANPGDSWSLTVLPSRPGPVGADDSHRRVFVPLTPGRYTVERARHEDDRYLCYRARKVSKPKANTKASRTRA